MSNGKKGIIIVKSVTKFNLLDSLMKTRILFGYWGMDPQRRPAHWRWGKAACQRWQKACLEWRLGHQIFLALVESPKWLKLNSFGHVLLGGNESCSIRQLLLNLCHFFSKNNTGNGSCSSSIHLHVVLLDALDCPLQQLVAMGVVACIARPAAWWRWCWQLLQGSGTLSAYHKSSRCSPWQASSCAFGRQNHCCPSDSHFSSGSVWRKSPPRTSWINCESWISFVRLVPTDFSS